MTDDKRLEEIRVQWNFEPYQGSVIARKHVNELLSLIDRFCAELKAARQLNDAARELFAAFPREAPANFNIPGYLVTNLENAIRLDDEMKSKSAP